MPLIDITTNIGCRNACAYCPQSSSVAEYAKRSGEVQMTFGVFQQCIDKTPTGVAVAFAGMTEPWLNPECTRMVQYACQTGHEVWAFTTAVGMTLEDVEQLARIPFAWFVVHLPSAEGHESITVDEGYLSVLERLLESGIVDHCHCHGAAVHPLIESVCDGKNPQSEPRTRVGHVRIEFYPPQPRAGNVQAEEVARPKRIKGRLYCTKRGQHLLLPNGEVLVCSLDYRMQHVIGNLRDNDYDSLFAGQEYLFVQKGLEDASLEILCRFCEHALRIGLRHSVPRWFRAELRGARTPRDLLAIAPRFVRAGAEHLRRGASVPS